MRTGLPSHRLCQTRVTLKQRPLTDGGSLSQRHFPNCHGAQSAVGKTYSLKKKEGVNQTCGNWTEVGARGSDSG